MKLSLAILIGFFILFAFSQEEHEEFGEGEHSKSEGEHSESEGEGNEGPDGTGKKDDENEEPKFERSKELLDSYNPDPNERYTHYLKLSTFGNYRPYELYLSPEDDRFYGCKNWGTIVGHEAYRFSSDKDTLHFFQILGNYTFQVERDGKFYNEVYDTEMLDINWGKWGNWIGVMDGHGPEGWEMFAKYKKSAIKYLSRDNTFTNEDDNLKSIYNNDPVNPWLKPGEVEEYGETEEEKELTRKEEEEKRMKIEAKKRKAEEAKLKAQEFIKKKNAMKMQQANESQSFKENEAQKSDEGSNSSKSD